MLLLTYVILIDWSNRFLRIEKYFDLSILDFVFHEFRFRCIY